MLQSKFNLPQIFITIQLGVANNQPNPKSWSLPNWNQLVASCVAAGHHVVLLGDKNEVALGDKILEDCSKNNITNLIGKTSIIDLVHILKKSKLTLGVDSGIAHLASVLKCKTIVLWGPSVFSKSHPIGENVTYINRHMLCAPCMGPGLYTPKDSLKNCGYGIACMNDISVKTVMDSINNYFFKYL